MTRYTKTIVALLGALATWGVTAGEDSTYSQVELWGAVLALATAAGVYALPNTPPAGQAARPDMSERDAGRALLGTLGLVLIVLAVVLAVLTLLGLIAVSLLTALIVGLVGLALILVDGSI